MKTSRCSASRYGVVAAAFCIVAASLAYTSFAFAQTKPAWQERWDKVLAAAKKEGTVVVLGPPGDVIRNAMIDGFKKAYPGINLEYSGGRSGEQAVKLGTERDGGIYSADVFLGGPTTANFQLKPMKALDPVRPALILPEVVDTKYWRDNKHEFSDSDGLYDLVFVGQASSPIVYDSRQVKREEVEKVNDLLNPKFKGKIVVNDPMVSGAAVPVFRFIWEMLGPQKATDYYKRLRENAAVVDRDQRRQIEWVAQGKYAILVAPSDGVMAQLLHRGVKFDVLEDFKDIGTYIGASFGTAMLVNKAPHPNGATVFLNWLLTKDAQTLWSKAMNHVSRRLDVPTDHLFTYMVPKPGVKYWAGYSEKAQTRTPEEEKILKELFGR
ncbi:MAG TPA: extracellular solute-binding protein [Candidatus Binatia bacterium]|jgi:ABC-type Fe3+ transport system substrate-binding protein